MVFKAKLAHGARTAVEGQSPGCSWLHQSVLCHSYHVNRITAGRMRVHAVQAEQVHLSTVGTLCTPCLQVRQFRYRFRNTSLVLQGPKTCRQVIEALSRNVAIEVRQW